MKEDEGIISMNVLKKIRDRFFYDPYRIVRQSRNICMGESQLSRSFRARFDCPREDVALRIGNRCLLNNSFVFESTQGKVTVGDGVFINSGTTVISHSLIEIGNYVTIAWGCTIYDHDSHSLFFRDRMADQAQQLIDYPNGNLVANKNWSTVAAAPIRICDHAWLGMEVLILKGVTIGEGAIVGARSVVTRDVPPWAIAAGNPARVVKEIPTELRRNS